MHGFTTAYRETGHPKMLETAERVCDYFISRLPAIRDPDTDPSDVIPPWDFNAPSGQDPKDASAAAVAASALLELHEYLPDKGYKDVAVRILETLASPAYLASSSTKPLLSVLDHATQFYKQGLYDHGLVYADYYFLQALNRLAGHGRSADL